MNFDVSVIVPVYGVEQYIQNCVDHLLNQTLENLEVVLVNDCTPDRSMEICEELYGDNERVQLINQPCNMGAGEARNAGIRKARGKYIGFVDSDDQVLPEMFETMYRTAVEFDADVVHNTGIIAIVPAQGDVIPVDMADPDRNLLFQVTVDQKPVTEAALFSDDMDDRLDCWLMHGCHWAVWNQLYRREFLLEHDIFFAKMKLAEDLLFSLTCLFTAERYVRLPGEWYIYRPAANSLSRSGDSLRGTLKALDSQLRGLEAIRERIRTIPYFRDNRGRVERIMVRPAVYTGRGNRFVQEFREAYEHVSGESIQYRICTYDTCAQDFPSAITFGPVMPGTPDTRNQVNESIRVRDLMFMQTLFERVMSNIVFVKDSFRETAKTGEQV